MSFLFKDRTDAGERLSELLPHYRARPRTVVVGLSRGGVPVAAALSRSLELPLDALPVRKLGIPGFDQTAFGAVAWIGGKCVRLLNKPLHARVQAHGVTRTSLAAIEVQERSEVARRAALYGAAQRSVTDATVLLVDDGMATGATMRAAVEAVRASGAGSVVVLAPVASAVAAAALDRVSDAVLYLHLPGKFHAVGSFYTEFEKVTDDDVVCHLLAQQPTGPVSRG
ncbi:phosphoribosyltransferase family protein [Pseudarthrobacter sp. PS3-L1]|uniref:phosphoribosyltransferase n=1 Tax=Pseudarthrobacter sp. PS3-L1 TaxID=3046207 RepID=UPI0024BA65C1|nr:phosphoribosyltransferase family protein [Pseudarthrobacter sp. PS3-L1]MDJ0321615.1 phosphoribosyltransferase family protein [Pseudarthrobacter sp. PS3-L1]